MHIYGEMFVSTTPTPTNQPNYYMKSYINYKKYPLKGQDDSSLGRL